MDQSVSQARAAIERVRFYLQNTCALSLDAVEKDLDAAREALDQIEHYGEYLPPTPTHEMVMAAIRAPAPLVMSDSITKNEATVFEARYRAAAIAYARKREG